MRLSFRCTQIGERGAVSRRTLYAFRHACSRTDASRFRDVHQDRQLTKPKGLRVLIQASYWNLSIALFLAQSAIGVVIPHGFCNDPRNRCRLSIQSIRLLVPLFALGN